MDIPEKIFSAAAEQRATIGLMGPLDMVSLYFRLQAPRTRLNYEAIWTKWKMLLVSPFANATPETAEELHALQFVEWCRRRGNCDGTIRHYVAVMHAIYAYLLEKGVVRKNIWADLQRVTRKARVGDIRRSHPLTEEQTARLLDAPDRFTPQGIRDRAILALLWGGFRVGEVLQAKIGGYRTARDGTKYLHLMKTKTGHGEERALSAWCAERVEAWIEIRRLEGAGDDAPIVTRLTGRGLRADWRGSSPSSSCVNGLVKMYARRAGISGRISAHYGRCTAINYLIKTRGASKESVRKLTGHASTRMVDYYLEREDGIEGSAARDLDYGLNGLK